MYEERHPGVSVIIPAYNAGKYISSTIESVLNQQYTDLEVIVVDDGSTDNTGEIVQHFLHDARVKYIKQNNAGCSGAKSTGLNAATGSYLQYLDADDILSTDKIEEQVRALNGKPLTVAVCKTKTFISDISTMENKELDTAFLFNTSNTFEFLLNLYGINGKGGMIQPNAFLIPRTLAEKAGEWNTSLSPSPDEDGEYFCRILLASEALCFTPNGINFYRQSNSGLSLSKQVSHLYATGALKSIDLITKHLLTHENSSRVKELMARHYAFFIYLYSFYSDLAKAAEDKVYEMGCNRIPAIGGTNFKRAVKLIGFKNAMRLKGLVNAINKPRQIKMGKTLS